MNFSKNSFLLLLPCVVFYAECLDLVLNYLSSYVYIVTILGCYNCRVVHSK